MLRRPLAVIAACAVGLAASGTALAGSVDGSRGVITESSRAGTWDRAYTYSVAGRQRTCVLSRGATCVGARLRGRVTHHGDLRKANLRRADLRFADLRGANLSGADLRAANLTYADLRGARLTGARLQQAPAVRSTRKASNALVPSCYPDCIGANLQGVDAAGADLSGAHMGLANISDADFTGANLTKSSMVLTTMNGTDFRSADLTGSIVWAIWTTPPVMNPGTTCPQGFSADIYDGNRCNFDLPPWGSPPPAGARPPSLLPPP